MQHSDPTDDLLVDLMQSGDQAAFEVIYRRYWRKLYGFVFRQLGSKEEAEEVLHDLMLSLWQNRGQARIQNLEVYLFIATRNLTNKAIKSQISLRKYREYQLLNLVDETFETEAIIDADDLAAAIESVLGQLPEKTATIFRLSKLDQLPVKAIASRMDLTEKAVEYHITKSLKMMRKHLGSFHSDN